MAYELQAVIAQDELLRSASRDVPEARLACLRQGLSLMPMTDQVLHAVTGGSSAGVLGFRRLPESFEQRLARWSVAGPVAYVQAEFFGGVGEERAAVWMDGALSWGPLDESDSPSLSPLSQALRRLGVTPSPGEDEFQAAGLNRHRYTDDWVSSAT
ncbi:hypothetical protein [Streptomyces sp. NPDC014006]|uniref:hypothetical protein n=1 Tax=Streptomyces sp. NPDC014006 TaxID=3364870 RepID=UPI0036F854CB